MPSIPEYLFNLVFASLTETDATIQTAIGRRATETFDIPHRVVAIPLGSPTIRDADRPGDGGYSNEGRILYVREFQSEWQVHDVPSFATTVEAPDFTNAENLLSLTVTAIRSLFHNSVHFSNEQWIDQQVGQDGVFRNGTVITFIAQFDIPLYEARAVTGALTPIDLITTTLELNSDSSNEVTINQGTG